MKTYQTITKTETIEHKVFCDICNEEFLYKDVVIWGDNYSQKNDSLCEEFFEERIEKDICWNCFKTKIVVFIEMFNKKVKNEN